MMDIETARGVAQQLIDGYLDTAGLRERLAEHIVRTSPGGQAEAKAVLDAPMPRNDADAPTVRAYLKALLITLLTEGEGFSGKRPFGNSGWEYDLEASMIKAGLVAGELDEDGGVMEGDSDKAREMIINAVRLL